MGITALIRNEVDAIDAPPPRMMGMAEGPCPDGWAQQIRPIIQKRWRQQIAPVPRMSS